MKPISEYSKIDGGFNEAAFSEKLGNIFYRLKCALSDGKLPEMEPYLTKDFYNKLDSSLKSDENRNRLLYTERITVLGTRILGFEQTGENDVLETEVRARIVEYYVKPGSNKRISGGSEEQFVDYMVRLVRKTGLVTADIKGISKQNCPYCGAPANINQTTRCEYCGRILNTDNFDWQISSLES